MENSKKKANVCCFSPACRTALAAPVMSASLCVPDKTQHRCDDVIRKVAEDFLFVCFFIVKVMQFNRERAAPDVSQEEHSHNFSVTNLSTETGFRYTDFTQTHTG